MDLQIPQELNPEYKEAPPTELFKHHPVLSSLSLLELSAKLHEFQTNPFFSYLSGVLQETADQAIVSIISGFQVRDRTAILEREQTIGAAPAYLKFAQLTDDLRTTLTEALNKQSNG
jgi:hypothetical protein